MQHSKYELSKLIAHNASSFQPQSAIQYTCILGKKFCRSKRKSDAFMYKPKALPKMRMAKTAATRNKSSCGFFVLKGGLDHE